MHRLSLALAVVVVALTGVAIAPGAPVLAAPDSCPNQPRGYACVIFVNESSVWLMLYIDRTSRCGADAHSYCVANLVRIGPHQLAAVTAEGTTVSQRQANVGENGVIWRVWD